MTRCAAGPEERLAGFRIADDDIRRSLARFVVSGGPEGVNVCGDVGDLVVGERKLRHTAIEAAVLHDWSDELAVLIFENDLRAQEARPAVAAARVCAVAERAVHAVLRFAALDRCGIAGGPRRKRLGEPAAAPPSPTALAWWILLRGRNR